MVIVFAYCRFVRARIYRNMVKLLLVVVVASNGLCPDFEPRPECLHLIRSYTVLGDVQTGRGEVIYSVGA